MRFVAKRLLLFVAALTGLSILVFLALRVLPGDVAAVMARNERDRSPYRGVAHGDGARQAVACAIR